MMSQQRLTRTIGRTAWMHIYVFNIDKKSININQLIRALAHFNIRDLEDRLESNQLHWLIHTPDKLIRQTLCVMPVEPTKMCEPGEWETLKKQKFYLINGQHNIEASKKVVELKNDEDITKHFQNWNCFVV